MKKFKWSKFLWHKGIPPNIGVFAWKLLHNGVPTDSRIMRMNIPYCSRCRCCTPPSIETTSHLFVHSQLATAIWSFLSKSFPISGSPTSLYFITSLILGLMAPPWGIKLDLAELPPSLLALERFGFIGITSSMRRVAAHSHHSHQR